MSFSEVCSIRLETRARLGGACSSEFRASGCGAVEAAPLRTAAASRLRSAPGMRVFNSRRVIPLQQARPRTSSPLWTRNMHDGRGVQLERHLGLRRAGPTLRHFMAFGFLSGIAGAARAHPPFGGMRLKVLAQVHTRSHCCPEWKPTPGTARCSAICASF